MGNKNPHKTHTNRASDSEVHRAACEATKKGSPVDWADILKAVTRTKPPCAAYASSLIGMIRNFGGGAGAGFVEDFVVFHRKYIPAERVIKGAFWDLVSGFKAPSGASLVLLRWALIKAEYKAPASRMNGNEPKYITRAEVGDLTNVKKAADRALVAEALLSSCRKLVLESKARTTRKQYTQDTLTCRIPPPPPPPAAERR